MPLQVTKVNGVDVTTLDNTDPTFLSLYKAVNPDSTAAPVLSEAGPIQYPAFTSGKFTTLYVCMIAAKVN
jgi:hypothetical protein